MKGKFPAAVVILYKKEIFSEICKKSTRFVGSISERTFAVPMSPGRSQTEIKNFPSSFWLKIPRRNGRALNHLHVPWQFHNHSSDTFFPTRAGRPCAMTIIRERQPRASTARQQPARRRRRDRTMILLERAGRKRRGGTPMDPIRCRASDESKAHGDKVK